MKVLSAIWADADKKAVAGEALLDDGTKWPYCVHANYDTKLGREIWDLVNSDEFGQVDDYSPPPPEPDPIPDEISRRQFFQYLAALEIITRQEALAALQTGAIPTPLQAIIEQLPTEDDRFEAQMFIVGAQNFNRLHPLSETVRLSLEWTVEQKDDFWREASKL